ncbi:MAG: hypothetical protein FWD98_06915 [Defluviitaleaceae bacterium]|nr:hypothetical protein [Defluviitaleaceae bacterium]
MSTKADLINAAMWRIEVLELKLRLEPDSTALKELLAMENKILEEIKKAD